jgi:hypothetical protein
MSNAGEKRECKAKNCGTTRQAEKHRDFHEKLQNRKWIRDIRSSYTPCRLKVFEAAGT